MSERKTTQMANTNKDVLYNSTMLEMKVTLLPSQIGKVVTKENLRDSIEYFIGGKCIEEGYVQPQTVDLKTYSSGSLKGDKVEFHVVFECKTYRPAEGTWIYGCHVKSVTKAGIHANIYDKLNNVPATVFVIRDHLGNKPQFNDIQENDRINIKVIGSRFELNDPCVEILGDLMPADKKI